MRIHFIGIGGVSMCQLAALLESYGHEVTGSDVTYLGHSASNVRGAELVVYSSAISSDNIELVTAVERGIPVIERAELLGRVARFYKNTIAVSGTHGKSTVTGMLWQIFSPLSPTVHLGGSLQKSRFPLPPIGGKDYFITEACEYKRSFLHITPSVAIILNTELDHTDCYSSLGSLLSAFEAFALSAQNLIVVNSTTPLLIQSKLTTANQQIVTFGIEDGSDYEGIGLHADENGCFSFSVNAFGKMLGKFKLSVPGIHNVLNALAAIAVADYYSIAHEYIAQGLKSFSGIARRFEFLGYLASPSLPPPQLRALPLTTFKNTIFKNAYNHYNYSNNDYNHNDYSHNNYNRNNYNRNNYNHNDYSHNNYNHNNEESSGQKNSGQESSKVRVYSDYAHHPHEIESSINAARMLTKGRLVVVFESHTYTRTASFLSEFSSSLMLADEIIILPIYAAREKYTGKVSALDLYMTIRKKLCNDNKQNDELNTEQIYELNEENYKINHEENYKINHEKNYEINHEKNYEINTEQSAEKNAERNDKKNGESRYKKNDEHSREKNYEKKGEGDASISRKKSVFYFPTYTETITYLTNKYNKAERETFPPTIIFMGAGTIELAAKISVGKSTEE